MGSNSPAGFLGENQFRGTSAVKPIIPKLEPLDEPPPAPPGFYLSDPSSTSTAPMTRGPSTADANVYSDFNRITELFRNALSQKFHSGGDITGFHDSEPNSRAIVPHMNSDTAASDVLQVPRAGRKGPSRSSELVRVTDLKADDQLYFRNVVRKTRMLFDSLRVFAVAEDEKNRDTMFSNRRLRGDLKAAELMRHTGLWLNRDKRIVGDIPGINIGDVFFCRMELCVVGLHGQPQAGIDYVPANQSSNGEPVATSVVVSGGYEDDEDAGDVIIYTGHGGQDKQSRQVTNQRLECGNLALERSMNYGVEIRVIRGFKTGGGNKIYVYDGLYRVMDTWFDVGKSGFGVFKFRLVRIENQVEMGSTIMKFAESLRKNPLELRPKGYVSLDLSKKKEKMPVLFFNDIDGDQDPLYYEYLVTTIFPSFVYNNGSNTGCRCVERCSVDCLCARKNGGEFAYDLNGTLVRGKPLIFECGPHCHCPSTCRNRVSQNGVSHCFEVFRSRQTGWGVRSLDVIQAGSFICEYSGVVLTREQAQIFAVAGDTLIHPSRFAERWKEWGELSQIFSDYVCPTHPSSPPLDFAVDVSRMRNVACYMSHSSCPNVLVQFVLYDHNNVSFPHLMLFASENIPPMRELSLDYGLADEWMGKLAICN